MTPNSTAYSTWWTSSSRRRSNSLTSSALLEDRTPTQLLKSLTCNSHRLLLLVEAYSKPTLLTGNSLLFNRLDLFYQRNMLLLKIVSKPLASLRKDAWTMQVSTPSLIKRMPFQALTWQMPCITLFLLLWMFTRRAIWTRLTGLVLLVLSNGQINYWLNLKVFSSVHLLTADLPSTSLLTLTKMVRLQERTFLRKTL